MRRFGSSVTGIDWMFYLCRFSVSFYIRFSRASLTLLLRKILTKSWSVILRAPSLFCPFYLGSKACRSLTAKSELGARPRLMSGLMISSASRVPEPSSSHDMKRFVANSIFLRFNSSSSRWRVSRASLSSLNLCLLTQVFESRPLINVRGGRLYGPNFACTACAFSPAIFSSIASCDGTVGLWTAWALCGCSWIFAPFLLACIICSLVCLASRLASPGMRRTSASV